jgi:ferrochelatase
MIGWPTMMTLAQREAGRREREQARAAALALGAEN